MTRNKMFDRCIEMWNEIAEEGYTDKWQSRYIEKYLPVDNCFACEYYISCLKEGCPFKLRYDGCSANYSPYLAWIATHKREHAIAIADLFIEYYDK